MSEVQRKLATIRTVKELAPIAGADLIELAKIDGWQCIVKKGEFNAGDKGVYFEIDSFLPIDGRFEFLRKSSFRTVDGLGEGFRIKTMKMKGVLSQGLLLPVTAFSELSSEECAEDNITEFLGVQKFELPMPVQLRGQVERNFPAFIPKTDQERVQNIYDYWSEKYRDHHFEVTVKLDGSSMTMYYHEGHFGVCSRNLELKINDKNAGNAFVKTALKYRDAIIAYCEKSGESIAIQGELIGPGIQGNPEALKDAEFFCFDVWWIKDATYRTKSMRRSLCEILNIPHVPVLSVHKCPQIFMETESLDDLLSCADGQSLNAKTREGIVFKSIEDADVHFKVISNKYLLKEES